MRPSANRPLPEGLRHPGDFLRELIDRFDGLTQAELAERMDTTRYSVNQLVNGRRSVTPEMALRLARVFSTTPEFWLNMQMAIDLANAEHALRKELNEIEPVRNEIPESQLFVDIP